MCVFFSCSIFLFVYILSILFASFLHFCLFFSAHYLASLSSLSIESAAFNNLFFVIHFLCLSHTLMITFIFVFAPSSLVSCPSPNLSHSFFRLEDSSWRDAVLMASIFVRISTILPVCQLSLPATWPGFLRYVLYLCLKKQHIVACLVTTNYYWHYCFV